LPQFGQHLTDSAAWRDRTSTSAALRFPRDSRDGRQLWTAFEAVWLFDEPVPGCTGRFIFPKLLSKLGSTRRGSMPDLGSMAHLHRAEI
jgi:hypothetical protein